MQDPNTKRNVTKSFNTNFIKVYSLVYTIVAIPMAYYGMLYIEYLNKHMTLFLPLTACVMILSVLICLVVQKKSNKQINMFLNDKNLNDYNLSLLKKTAYHYPFYITGVMVFGWLVLFNLIVIFPIYFIYSAGIMEIILSWLLIFSSGFMSAPITFFISENSSSKFLSLDDVRNIKEPTRTLRINLTLKILLVCLIIISTLILNTIASMMLGFVYKIDQLQYVINFIIIGIQGIITTVVISILFSHSIKRPISNMADCSEFIKIGDLSVLIPRLSNDELGDTSVSFNNFMNNLSNIISDIKTNAKDTRDIVYSLQQAMNKTDMSVEEINVISNKVQKIITNQSGIISEIAETMKHIASNIENHDKRIDDQSVSVQESSAAIREMIANIQSISVNLNNSAEQFNNLQDAISTGNNNIERMKETVLNLNRQSDAAIEAAHAGEAGKGFAVVADEIRKLAEVSDQQSKLISDSLKNLQQSIDESVHIAEETGVSFKKIIKSLEIVAHLESEIKNAIEEQSSGSNQILQSINEINNITDEVHAGSREMTEGSNIIFDEINNLLEITDVVKNSALEVVEKAKTVKQNTDRSLEHLAKNQSNTEKIDEKIGIFKLKSDE